MNAPRRSSYTSMPVAYAAIGASGAADLLRFPPADSTPYEESLQLGSGQDRFLTAANLLMTWGAHRAAGVEVLDVERGEAVEYQGVQFDDGGTPEPASEPEETFTPEGVAYISPGTTATLVATGGKRRPVLVISTIAETERVGLAIGDRESGPGFGEQLITVEQRPDGTVWAVVRGFSYLTNSGLMSGLKQRSELRDVLDQVQAYLQALAPGAAIRTGVVAPGAAGDAAAGEVEAGEAGEAAQGDAGEAAQGESPADASSSADAASADAASADSATAGAADADATDADTADAADAADSATSQDD